jgi:cell division protein FtsN
MNQQRGSTLVGFIIGLLVGMTVALGVAIYVTKVPIPFMNKGQARTAEQEAAEAEKNKDWDPNAPLYGKKGNKSGDKADETKPDAAAKVDPKSADPLGDLAKVKAAEPKPDAKAKSEAKAAEPKPVEAKPVEAKASEKAADAMVDVKPSNTDPFIYFVQAGAYRTPEEAQAQRAKTALLGLDSKISERDQGGRTVYRVRVGPLDKAEAERVRAKLDAAHIDSAMVRVQR